MSAADRTIPEYDEVPYTGKAIPLSHPCHLAMVGRLCGLRPAPPAQCRVLELGCAVGTNLLPMAEAVSLPALELAPAECKFVAHGRSILRRGDWPDGLHAKLCDSDRRLIAIAEFDAEKSLWLPRVVLVPAP